MCHTLKNAKTSCFSAKDLTGSTSEMSMTADLAFFINHLTIFLDVVSPLYVVGFPSLKNLRVGYYFTFLRSVSFVASILASLIFEFLLLSALAALIYSGLRFL